MPPSSSPLWYSLSSAEALKQLGSFAHGLTQEEAVARLKVHGENTVQVAARTSVIQRFLHQLHDPLIYVLFAAGCVTALLQHWTDTGVIAAVVVINALIGFIQEQKAENALAAIRQLLSANANVLRGGQQHMLPAKDIVPGDIVLLAAGDKVPADLRLLTAHSLRTQEAILTGESLDIEKSTHASPADASLGERVSMTYSGTLVTAGQGKGVVVATGTHTEIGRISVMLTSVETPDTPLTRKLTRFSRWLAGAVVLLALLVFALGVVVRGLPMEEMFMVMIAIAVSAIPEGLPAVISITLALGVRAMAKRNAIVRHLPVIEALGNVTVICTDKTGTLTRNELTVTDIITSQRLFSVTGVGYAPDGKILLQEQEVALTEYPAVQAMAYAAALNNDATLRLCKGVWELNGDPTEGALMAFAYKAGNDREALCQAWPRADVIPFSAEARYMATLHHGSQESVIYVKGAPEEVLAMCRFQQDGYTEHALDTEYWKARVPELAGKGKRVLAVAKRNASEQKRDLKYEDVKEGLTLLGLFGIMDMAREEAKPAISACLAADITVKMITGDHALTASAIGTMLGIPESGRVMTGQDIDCLSEVALAQAVEEVNIYARMHPEHKLKLVRALQAKGEVVAMTGDGVNDAPALKMADIGIAMGRAGTEVAKEASALVLADDNFTSIVSAVEEGRNIYRNIRRTIQFMLVTDGCEGLVLVLATLMGFALPITPLQILWVNMVTAVTLSLSFAFAPYDPDVMRQKPIPLNAPVFSRQQIVLFLWHVTIMAAGTIGLFLYEIRSGEVEVARTMAVNALVGFQIYYLWGLLLMQKKREHDSRAYLPLIGSTVAILTLQTLLTYTPWMQGIFLTASLDVQDWLKINAVAIAIALWIMIEKRLFPGSSRIL